MVIIDDAIRTGDSAAIAAACLRHPAMVLVPDCAAEALHEVARSGVQTADDYRLLQLATDFIRRVELVVGRETDVTN